MVWIQLWLANYDLLCCQWIKWCLLNCSDRKLYRKIISTKNAGETMTCSGSFKHLPYITLKAWSWVFVQTSHTHTHTHKNTGLCWSSSTICLYCFFTNVLLLLQLPASCDVGKSLTPGCKMLHLWAVYTSNFLLPFSAPSIFCHSHLLQIASVH